MGEVRCAFLNSFEFTIEVGITEFARNVLIQRRGVVFLIYTLSLSVLIWLECVEKLAAQDTGTTECVCVCVFVRLLRVLTSSPSPIPFMFQSIGLWTIIRLQLYGDSSVQAPR